jgi:hypothetical protein
MQRTDRAVHVLESRKELADSALDSNTPPQGRKRPNCDAKCFTFGEERGLVSASAVMSSVGQ